jgi:hypothetical protein
LGEPDEGVVDSTVTVWVVTTHNVSDNTSTLGEVAIGSVTTVIHGVQHPAVNWLESVTDIRQCSGDNNGHGVIKIGTLHFSLQVNRLDPAVTTYYFDFNVV